jgi:hypothetical protein
MLRYGMLDEEDLVQRADNPLPNTDRIGAAGDDNRIAGA